MTSFAEPNFTLMSTGLGMEWIYRSNVNIRLDWGIVLRDEPQLDSQAGDMRLHFLASILF